MSSEFISALKTTQVAPRLQEVISIEEEEEVSN
jgi:hypothetical protein